MYNILPQLKNYFCKNYCTCLIYNKNYCISCCILCTECNNKYCKNCLKKRSKCNKYTCLYCVKHFLYWKNFNCNTFCSITYYIFNKNSYNKCYIENQNEFYKNKIRISCQKLCQNCNMKICKSCNEYCYDFKKIFCKKCFSDK